MKEDRRKGKDFIDEKEFIELVARNKVGGSVRAQKPAIQTVQGDDAVQDSQSPQQPAAEEGLPMDAPLMQQGTDNPLVAAPPSKKAEPHRRGTARLPTTETISAGKLAKTIERAHQLAAEKSGEKRVAIYTSESIHRKFFKTVANLNGRKKTGGAIHDAIMDMWLDEVRSEVRQLLADEMSEYEDD